MTNRVDLILTAYIATDNQAILDLAEHYAYTKGNGNYAISVDDTIEELESLEDGSLALTVYEKQFLDILKSLPHEHLGDAIVYYQKFQKFTLDSL